MGRIQKFLSFFALSVMTLGLSAVVSAQYRDQRNQRDNSGYYGNQDLSSTARNLKSQSRQFEKTLDRELDRSRIDGSQREDNLNRLAGRFKDAADKFEDKYDGRRNQSRSAGDASQMISVASQLDGALSASRVGRNNNTISQIWNSIEQNLRIVSRAYNISYDGRYGRNGNWGGNNDDDWNDNDGRNGRNNGPRGGNNGRYNDRNLGPTISSLKSKARDLENTLDRDRNNRNNSNLERLSDRFKRAADRLENEFRSRDGAYNEARNVISIGEQLDREMSQQRVNRGIRRDWSSIERDLQTIARAYNLTYNKNNGNSGTGGWRNFPNFPFPF